MALESLCKAEKQELCAWSGGLSFNVDEPTMPAVCTAMDRWNEDVKRFRGLSPGCDLLLRGWLHTSSVRPAD